jgi:GNAT superfamily N-acetyltransferase
VQVRYEWRGAFEDDEVDQLHAAAFRHPLADDDWRSRVERHSLGWVTARDDAETLVGFANVAWDGGSHAFVLDVAVAPTTRRSGIGRSLLALAEREARNAGCAWLHADFEPALAPFYAACGFAPSPAGLIRL